MTYKILYKIFIVPKPLHVRFNKADRLIRIYDESRYLAFLGFDKYDAIYNGIRHLVTLKSSATCFFSLLWKIKVDSYDSFPIEERFTLHDVITLSKSVLNKDKNHYCYNLFLEKCSY